MGILANESLTKVLWNEYIIFEVSRSKPSPNYTPDRVNHEDC